MLTRAQIRFRRNICINVLLRCDEREQSFIRWYREGIHLPAAGGLKEYHSHLPKEYLDRELAELATERSIYTALLRELEGNEPQMMLAIAA